MKKIIILAFVASLIVSCGTMNPTVGLYLSSVNDKPTNGMSYIDDTIAIDWSYINKSRLNFKLQNKSNANIKIIWDNAAYVEISGSTVRVMHSGVKYNDRNITQAPSVIPSGAFIEDAILPTNVVDFQPYVGWTEGDMFGVSYDPAIAKKQLSNTYGKVVRVLLPIEVNGIIKEYSFVFTVTPYDKNSNERASDGKYENGEIIRFKKYRK